jgi:signal transduction histidine kinase
LATNASHQLRTPLTALRLELESALNRRPEQLADAVEGALSTADQLAVTIDDMLAAVRTAAVDADDPTELVVAELLDDVQARWHGIFAARGRRLAIGDDTASRSDEHLEGVGRGGRRESAATTTPRSAARQIVDVLVDNALRHGSGEVTVLARVSGDAIAIDVSDEGVTSDLRLPTRRPHDVDGLGAPSDDQVATGGLGLALARDLAEAYGGRIVLGPAEDHTRVSVLLPRRREPRGLPGEESRDSPMPPA